MSTSEGATTDMIGDRTAVDELAGRISLMPANVVSAVPLAATGRAFSG